VRATGAQRYDALARIDRPTCLADFGDVLGEVEVPLHAVALVTGEA